MVDSSAVLAILWQEAESARFTDRIAASSRAMIAAPNALELYVVAVRRTTDAVGDEAMQMLSHLGVEIAPFDLALVTFASDAFRRYGKGRHKAALNFGDCMAYALAKSLDAPLLYKGNDFALTDIGAAA